MNRHNIDYYGLIKGSEYKHHRWHVKKQGSEPGIRRKTLNTYIYKTKKYIIAQILWDLAGVICLAFSPLLQQWLFDYGLQSPLKKIVMANMFPYREMILQR